MEEFKTKLIEVIYSNDVVDQRNIHYFGKYTFICNYDVVVGDRLESPAYKTQMQVIKVEKYDESITEINGRALKELVVNKINNHSSTAYYKAPSKTVIKSEKKMKENKFNSIIEKYKSQYLPEKNNDFRLSMNGDLCVLYNDEYVSINKNNELTSYPEAMTLDIPVYTINKPVNQINNGDIVKHSKYSYSKVIGRTKDGKLKLLSYNGSNVYKADIKDFLLGQSFIKVVINMFQQTDIGSFNPLMMMCFYDGGMDIKDLMIMQMMSGNQNMGSVMNNGLNPMMMMMCSKEDSSMMETMMMMQMMSGNNMFNQQQS